MTFEERLALLADMLHPAMVQGRYREREALLAMIREIMEDYNDRDQRSTGSP